MTEQLAIARPEPTFEFGPNFKSAYYSTQQQLQIGMGRWWHDLVTLDILQKVADLTHISTAADSLPAAIKIMACIEQDSEGYIHKENHTTEDGDAQFTISVYYGPKHVATRVIYEITEANSTEPVEG